MKEYEDKAYLILADGTLYEGYSVGAKGTAVGEVVFNTSMTGYQETLTDPSYFGQLVMQTIPLIGNYGLNDHDTESSKCWTRGYIVREWCKEPSNFRSKYNIDEYLKKEGVIGISGVDTRAVTKKLRECGTMNGAICTRLPGNIGQFLDEIKEYSITDAVPKVSVTDIYEYDVENSEYNVVLYDYGYKKNILRSLNKRGAKVTIVPYNTPVSKLMSLAPDGIMLSNGPGNPEDNDEAIEILKEVMELDLPILGICLGHQLFALANGIKTEKLKYGHRGANQPVLDKIKDRVFVTSQNHGYAVMSDSIPHWLCQVSHINVNDGSCEGLIYEKKNAFTVQFHPEACAGPNDTQYLFDKFMDMMKTSKRRQNNGVEK